MSGEVKCPICGAVLKHVDSFKRHNRRFHRSLSAARTSVCSVCAAEVVSLKSHLRDDHGLDVSDEQLSFDSEEEFNVWKRSVELRNQAKYIRCSSAKRPDRTVVYFSCNRSGQPKSAVPDDKRKRRLKTKGSRKMGSQCLSRMTTNFYNDGTVTVVYCKTHCGHAMELKHLPNSSPTKKNPEAKRLTQIALDEISVATNQSGIELTTQHSDYPEDLYATTITPPNSEPTPETVQTPQEQLYIEICEENGETLLKWRRQLVTDDSYSHDENDLEIEKSRIQEDVSSIIRNIFTDAGLEGLGQGLKYIIPVIRVAENVELINTTSENTEHVNTNNRTSNSTNSKQIEEG